MQNNIIKGLFVGQNFVYLNEVDSTNNFLKDKVANSKPPPEGTVIMAGRQTAGRGQAAARWLSEAGMNITASILFYPTFLNARNQFDLNRALSLALIDTLEKYIPGKSAIKWPNDIYADGRKICGVLIENSLAGQYIRSSVVGIGLNVNQEIFDGAAGKPTSLKLLTSNSHDPRFILAELCGHAEAWYLMLRAGKQEQIRSAYDALLFQRNQLKDYYRRGEVFSGTVKGTDPQGRLLMQTAASSEAFDLKEIAFGL